MVCSTYWEQGRSRILSRSIVVNRKGMNVLSWCALLALSLTLAMATHNLIGDPPQLMIPQHPNVYVYENNSLGKHQNLVLPCPLVNTTNVTYKWFRGTEMVSSEMVDQTTGTLTVYNITDGEYASEAGVNYYCVASRVIGKGSYTASVRSRTIIVFYASFGGFRRMTEEDVFVPIALASEVALECDVLPSNPSPQITWRRDGIPVVLDARRRLLDGGHYFYVSRLEEADLMSTYRCEVTNALADRTIPAPTTYRLLDNLTRGELLEYKQIGNLRAFTVNSSIEFAYVGGFTNGGTVNGTTNRLTRDGTPVTSVGNIGLITDLSTPGTSNLEATVTFGGSALDKSGTLTVYQLPCITMSPPNNREIVVGEENLMYSCEFEGSPTPSIQWFFNGQPIAAESGVSVSDNTLMIAAPQVSNSGIYQCIVSNDFGDDQAAWLLEIRPSNQLRTCPGEQQSLLCSANYTLLEWNISIINQTLREARSVPYESQNPMITPIVINSTTFTFLRVSSQNALPLVSIMTIMNINSSLEGTMVSCTGINSSTVSSVVLMKVLHVIRDAPNPSEIAVRTDMIHFGNDNFTVTLEWRQFGGETYSVATIPDAEHIGFTTNSRAQLVMLYNTQYKVNVTAMPCGHRNFALYYAQCNSPLTDAVLTDTVMVISGTVPALQGQNITFSCFGNESWLALCNEYGRWDPDPTETCKRNPAVKQNQNTVTSIVVSSVIIFALSSILFFFIGCACGWFGHMRKTKGSDKNITSQAAPVYEDLQPSAFMPQDQEKNFELKENVAYGPV